MSFTITALGSSGGPLEGITCSYIVKPAYITYGEIINNKLGQYLIAIDAGSGLHRLAEIIDAQKHNETRNRGIATKVLQYYNDPLSLEEYIHEKVKISYDAGSCELRKDVSSIECAFEILDLINNFLITHPHLDHINGLVINSPGFHYHSAKRVYGIEETNEALQKFIFNDIIWPNLVSEENGSFLELVDMKPGLPTNINEFYQVIPFELNHGKIKNDARLEYKSTSFLIRDLKTSQCILIFGDVEADKNACSLKNHIIWENASDLVIRKELKTILIECSTPNLPAEEPRFGHLTPDSLMDELSNLARIVQEKTGQQDIEPLKDINILITHVKERRSGHEPRRIILQQLNELNDTYKLGCNFSVVLTGVTYHV